MARGGSRSSRGSPTGTRPPGVSASAERFTHRPAGLGLAGHGVITRALAPLPGSCGLRHRGGDHHGLTDHHVFTGSAAWGAALGPRRRLSYPTAAEDLLEPE